MTRDSRPLEAGVTLFTLGPNSCAMCHLVARWLRQSGIAYHEIDVNADEAGRQRLEEIVARDAHAPADPHPVPTLVLADGTVLIWPSPGSLASAFG